MFTITNGFTYIAFLMFLAGGLLALEKSGSAAFPAACASG